MIEAPAGVQPGVAPGLSCCWLDYVRGPEGSNHLQCRLTMYIFGPGRREDAVCLTLCAYPRQQQRGRCKHMDFGSIVPTDGVRPCRRSAARRTTTSTHPVFARAARTTSRPADSAGAVI
ncbi:MAG TPA: hypothetical protein VK009_27865 [Chloroflexota bacterium]|nr:hypothetical protein [Chloroflexota bacterium]